MLTLIMFCVSARNPHRDTAYRAFIAGLLDFSLAMTLIVLANITTSGIVMAINIICWILALAQIITGKHPHAPRRNGKASQ